MWYPIPEDQQAAGHSSQLQATHSFPLEYQQHDATYTPVHPSSVPGSYRGGVDTEIRGAENTTTRPRNVSFNSRTVIHYLSPSISSESLEHENPVIARLDGGQGDRDYIPREREIASRPAIANNPSAITWGVGIHQMTVGEQYQDQNTHPTVSERLTASFKKFGKALNEKMTQIGGTTSSSQTRDQEFQLPTPNLPIKQFSKVSDAGKTNSIEQNLLEELRLHVSSQSDPLDKMNFCAMWRCSTRNYNQEHGLPLPKPSNIHIGDVGILSPTGTFHLHASLWSTERGDIRLSQNLMHNVENPRLVEYDRSNRRIEVTHNLEVVTSSEGSEFIVFDRYPGDRQRFFLQTEGDLVRQHFQDLETAQEFVSKYGAQVHQEINASLSPMRKIEGPLVLIVSTTRVRGRVVRFMMIPLPKPHPVRRLYKMYSDTNLSEGRPPFRLRRTESFNHEGMNDRDYIGSSMEYSEAPNDVVYIQGLPIPPSTISAPVQ